MWFKNVKIYRLTRSIDLGAEHLATALMEKPFAPCAGQETLRLGWIPPLGQAGSEYIHVSDQRLMMCVKRQQRSVPNGVVNEHLHEKVQALEEAEGRRLNRKEKQAMKDDILFDLIPRAFAQSSQHFAYFDPALQLLLVDSASAKRAEEILVTLRETLGSLPVLAAAPQASPEFVMTEWLRKGGVDGPFTLGHECELRDRADEKRIIRCKNQDLCSQEILKLLDSGMLVTRLELHSNSGLSFILDQDFHIKRLSINDVIQEKCMAADSDTVADQFDIDFAIMGGEIAALYSNLMQAMGGEGELDS